ncbi:MAG: hypothetical protein JW889_05710 [Verrucomicrobia bacterium]|nr:hypothetical protein [Verrucomicrobiota bacterium]
MPIVVFASDQAPPVLPPLYAEARREQLRVLMTLAGGLAHNLRSPLTAVMGRAELVGIRNPGLGESMHEIVGECERINGMLHQVTGTLALEAEPDPRLVDLNDLVGRECAFMCFDRHFKHEIETDLRLAAGLPAITAMYGALAGAFRAVVENAVIALRTGAAPRLVISTALQGGAATLSVADTGCGISSELLPRVFDPGFTTLEGDCYRSSPVENTGRGYGLAYAAAAVHDHGGMLEVSSDAGAGTTVTMTLPVR